MSLLQELTAMATQAPESTAVALLLLDSSQESFILVTGPVLGKRTKEAPVRILIANVFVTLLEKLGEDTVAPDVAQVETPTAGSPPATQDEVTESGSQ